MWFQSKISKNVPLGPIPIYLRFWQSIRITVVINNELVYYIWGKNDIYYDMKNKKKSILNVKKKFLYLHTHMYIMHSVMLYIINN